MSDLTTVHNFNFVSAWTDLKHFYRSMSLLRVPNPTESWVCALGKRSVAWDGESVKLPDGFKFYEITYKSRLNPKTRERETALVVRKQGSTESETDGDFIFHICGVVKLPALWLIKSGLQWKLVVASNGFQSFVASCEVSSKVDKND